MQIEPELYPWFSAGVIAWGLLDCVFGYKIFKLTIAVLGGLIGTILGHAAGTALALSANGVLGTIVVGGVIGALLAFLLYIAAVALAGFLFGSILGILILAHMNQMVAVLGGCVIGLVCGYLAVKLQKVLIVLSTALLGAYRAILGIGYFTNDIDWLFYFREPVQIPALVTNTPWMFPSILALAAIGVIVQLELGKSSGKKKKKDED